MQLLNQPHIDEFNIRNLHTVKPPKRGHFGDGPFVLCSEVVLFWEVMLEYPSNILWYTSFTLQRLIHCPIITISNIIILLQQIAIIDIEL